MIPRLPSRCLSSVQAIGAPDNEQMIGRQLSGRLFAGWNYRNVGGSGLLTGNLRMAAVPQSFPETCQSAIGPLADKPLNVAGIHTDQRSDITIRVSDENNFEIFSGR